MQRSFLTLDHKKKLDKSVVKERLHIAAMSNSQTMNSLEDMYTHITGKSTHGIYIWLNYSSPHLFNNTEIIKMGSDLTI